MDVPVDSTITAPATAATPMRQCTECGQAHSPEDLLQLGGRVICAQCKPLFVQRLREVGVSASETKYAGFWIRAGARTIDAILMSMVASLVGMALVFPTVKTAHPDVLQILKAEGLVLLLSTIIASTYEIALTVKYGGTIGKFALGLRVVTAEGRPLGWGQSTGRYFATWISGCTFYIGYILAAFDEQKRALHDYVASTRVIRK